MNGGGPKARTRHARLNASETRQEASLVPVAGADAGTGQPMKRRPDAEYQTNPSPVKRPRLTHTGTQTDRIVSLEPFTGLQASADDVPCAKKQAALPQTNTRRSRVGREETSRAARTGRQQKPAEHPHTPLPASVIGRPEKLPPAKPPQKRRIDGGSSTGRAGDSDDRNERPPKRARLTRKNLALFNRMAKKKANKGSASAAPESGTTTSTTQTKTISTTSSGFADQADKNGILNTRRSKRPQNFEETANRLARSRETASPPEDEYRRYLKATGKSGSTEMTVLVRMAPLLKTYDDDDGYSQEFNRAFTNLPKDLGFNNGLSAPQPDFVEGLEKREYRPFAFDERIHGAVLYKDDPDALALAHLAGEWKGPGKDMEGARLQSAYDGAALVHGRSQALDSIGKPYLAGHAKVTTFTTDGTNLNFFAHYAAPTEDGTLEYHQYPITSTNLKNSFEEFKRARRQLRNAQDEARRESYEIRDQLKEYWKAKKTQPAPLASIEDEDEDEEEDDNGDEDGDDYEVVEQRPEVQPTYQPTPSASSKPRHRKTTSSDCPHTTASSPPPPAADQAPLSQSSTSHGSLDYWQVDGVTGGYFHVHMDGTVTWRNEALDVCSPREVGAE
ncbi:hypothetical protein SPI_07060 [Niveomyces insectorum RCEF 264]|uniref:Uncharacterized protein n=1 Tax=Niveomyces insectorum RCEF 264 TaxID=1081102 RepID=A0A167Q8I4_9HYPO|nr:hypothetical protein SPI_07060 [Niveomyces insectorum RCEF 264]